MSKLISTIKMTPLLALLLAAPAIALADTVGGYFEHNDLRTEFSHGIAVHWSDPDAAGGRGIVVLLSDAQPDAERGRGKHNPVGNIEAGLPFDSARLILHLDGSDAAPAIRQLSFSNGLMALSPGGDELRLENDRVIGTWVAAEMAQGGSRWQADVHFDLPLIDLDVDASD